MKAEELWKKLKEYMRVDYNPKAKKGVTFAYWFKNKEALKEIQKALDEAEESGREPISSEMASVKPSALKAEELWNKLLRELKPYMHLKISKGDNDLFVEVIQKALDDAELEGHDIGMKRAKVRIMEIIDEIKERIKECKLKNVSIQKDDMTWILEFAEAKIKEEFEE